VTKILVPRACLKDVEEIPKELRRKVTFVPVSNMREVLDEALSERLVWRPRTRRNGSSASNASPASFRED